MDSFQSTWGEQGHNQFAAPTPCSGCGSGVSHSSFSLPEPYLGRWLCGAKETSLRLHIQDVEQIRGLGLARNVDEKSEAIHSARANVVELGVEIAGWLSCQAVAPRTFICAHTCARTLAPTPPPILPRGSSLPHRCAPAWRPICPSLPAPCHLLLLPPPGRQGRNSCKCPSPQRASDSLTDLWWVLQDPSDFTLL